MRSGRCWTQWRPTSGPIDIYVANTGGPPRAPTRWASPTEQWAAAHRSLVISPMKILERLLPQMRERGFGRVVAVSSSSAREPIPGLQLSNANRAGLLAALKHLARESAGDGVTINAVLPGRIATERLRAAPRRAGCGRGGCRGAGARPGGWDGRRRSPRRRRSCARSGRAT